MTPELAYFTKINLAFILLYGFYRLFFYKDTYFVLRRLSLLLFFVLAFSYPLFNIQDWVRTQEPIAEVIYSYSALLPEVVVEEPGSFSWTQILGTVLYFGYFSVVAFLLARLLVQLFSILKILNRSKRSAINGIPVYLLPEPASPFSFFKAIFIYPANHSEKEIEEILTHECTHVRQWHSIDVILSELVTIICWVNPFIWLLKREIRHNLEYLADNTVIHAGYDSRAYQFHLLGLTHCRPTITLYNNFNVLDIKNRIVMMNKKRSSKMGRTKYIVFLPVAAFLMLFSNIEAVARITQDIAADIITGTGPVTVKGNVVDINGKPVSGASITVKDSKTGTVTDSEGNFILEADGKAMLVIYSRGYNQEERSVGTVRISSRIVLRKEDGSQVFTVVEEMPKYPGGDTQLLDFIAKNVKYPSDAQAQGKQGRVIVSFIVEKDGSSTNPEVVRGIDPSLDAEAIRVVSQLAKWIPGKQRGIPVRVKYTVPITFRLSPANAAPPKEESVKSELKNGLTVYNIVDVMPQFPGGDTELLSYIAKNIKYPKDAQEAGKQGRVICSFTVLKNGNIDNIEIVRSVFPSLDEESIRVIKSMPKWKPGTLKGEAVNVKYTVPLTYRLQ